MIDINFTEDINTATKKYPYIGTLKIDTGDILCVLFIRENTGIALNHKTDSMNSVITIDWLEHEFTPIKSLTINI